MRSAVATPLYLLLKIYKLKDAETKFIYIDRYIGAATKSGCLYCPVSPTSGRQRIISMSLYGSKGRYVIGAVRNAQLAPIIFPGWQIRFYCKSSGLFFDCWS